jgi:hypothetical protein
MEDKTKKHLSAMRDNILDAINDFAQNNDRKAMYLLGYTLRSFDEFLGEKEDALDKE